MCVGAEQRGQEEPHVNNPGDVVPRNPKMLCCGIPVLRIRWAHQGGKPRLGTESFHLLEPSITKAVAAHTSVKARPPNGPRRAGGEGSGLALAFLRAFGKGRVDSHQEISTKQRSPARAYPHGAKPVALRSYDV